MRRIALCTVSLLFVCALVAVPAPASAAEPGDNVTIYHTNESDFDGAAAVESSIENGPAHSAESMLVNETLILAIESRRLAADLDDRSGTPTERFFAALDGEAELGAKEGVLAPNTVVSDVSVPQEKATVYRSGTTTFLIIDPSNLRTSYGDEKKRPVSAGVLRFAFGYDQTGDLDDWPRVSLREERAHFSDDVRKLPTATTEIRFDVDVTPVNTVDVHLHLGTGETRTKTFDSESLHWASFDLSDVPNGTSYRLELVHDGTTIETQSGQVTDLEATVEDVRFLEQGNESVLNATATLSHGGDIYVLDDHGDQHARTDLSPGDRTELTVRLDDLDEYDDELTVHAGRADAPDEHYPGHDPIATVDLDDGTVSLTEPTVENARVTADGTGLAVNATATFPSDGTVYVLDQDGDLLGEASAPGGEKTDVSVPLDDLDDWDGDVTVHVTDSDSPDHPQADPVAELRIPEDEADDLSDANPSTNGSNASDDEPKSTNTESESIPGFGAQSALVALVAGALVARRRR